jgi:hypothetical protein
MVLESLLAVLVGYLLGAFPSAYIAARIVKGRDIRQVGGGNMGTLNTLREVGFIPGLLVFMADAAKGALAILAAKWLGVNEIIIFIAGLASVAGHSSGAAPSRNHFRRDADHHDFNQQRPPFPYGWIHLSAVPYLGFRRKSCHNHICYCCSADTWNAHAVGRPP